MQGISSGRATSDSMQVNIQTFDDREVVRYYADTTALQPPEAQILERLRGELAESRMLDIGVGAGRTTGHFAPLVRSYIGVDFAPQMIERCAALFDGKIPRENFQHADARDLSRFGEHAFDFVLFSYNGIDYVSHEDRLRVLQQIHRVLRPGGIFVFSTHQLRSLRPHFDWRRALRAHPLRALRQAAFQLRLRTANPGFRLDEALRRGWAVVNDGAHEFRALTYYVTPSEQARQLAGRFEVLDHFRLVDSGGRLSPGEAEATEDAWIYYLCRAR